MSSPNRAALLNKIFKVLKKHYKPIEPLGARSVLDHLLYACCLENAKFEAADEAFAKIQQSYFDLNEVRVTTVRELAEMLEHLPDSMTAAASVKRALQSVFEAHFTFDVELLKKQNLGKSEQDLAKFTNNNPFLIGYVAQHGLGGHAIPCGTAELNLLYVVGAITDAELAKRIVPGMERAIPKNKGIEFASLLHQLAAEFYASPNSTKIKAVLMEIDSESKDRLKLLMAKKEEPPRPAEPPKGKEAEEKKFDDKSKKTPPAPAERRKHEQPPAPAAKDVKPPAKSEKSSDKDKHKEREKEKDKAKKKEEKNIPHKSSVTDHKKAVSAESKKSDTKRLAKKKPR